jgi:glutaredoxin
MECINLNISDGDKHVISNLTKLDTHTYDNPGEWQGKEQTHVPVITINDNTMLVQVKNAVRAPWGAG